MMSSQRLTKCEQHSVESVRGGMTTNTIFCSRYSDYKYTLSVAADFCTEVL